MTERPLDDTDAASLTTEQFRRHFFFEIDPAGTPPDAAATITVPAVKRGLFVVRNNTAQAVTVTISGQSLTAPEIAAGAAALLSCDGTDVRAEGGGSGGAGTDELVKVSANDTTAGYLIGKLVAGAGVAAVETNDGSNESVTLRAARLDAIRIYTANDTWNKPADLDFTVVLVVGAGGGGGGCPATGAGQQAASAGGGGGGFSLKKIAAASLGASETVTVGAGGAGGVGGSAGSAGGTSSFGAHCSATGGAGGEAGPASGTGYFRLGGVGGLGSSGDLNVAGGDGGNAGVNGGARMQFGFGGSSHLGGGARSALSGTGRPGVCPGTGGRAPIRWPVAARSSAETGPTAS